MHKATADKPPIAPKYNHKKRKIPMLKIDDQKVTKNLPITHRIAEKQEAYLTLPANVDSGVVSFAFKLTLKEAIKALFKRRIFIYTLTFNKPLQPIHVSIDEKDFEQQQRYAIEEYGNKQGGGNLWVLKLVLR